MKRNWEDQVLWSAPVVAVHTLQRFQDCSLGAGVENLGSWGASGMARKRKSQTALPRSLVSHGESFMALFSSGDEADKRQKVIPGNDMPAPRRSTHLGLEPASDSDNNLEEDSSSHPDSRTSSEPSNEELSDGDNDSDSLDCLDALKLKLSANALDGNDTNANETLPSLAEVAEEDRDNFMSGKVGKVHQRSHCRKLWMDRKKTEEKDDEIARELFKQASKEVQMLGAKGMNKGATRNLKQREWERLGGKPRKSHRIPKSVGVVVHRNRLARECANKVREETEGRVLRDSLKMLKQQKSRKKKEHHKQRGGKLRNAVFQGS